jgi:dTDP-glucose 4,6-dehydratase
MKILVTGASGFVGSCLVERNTGFLGIDLMKGSNNSIKLDLVDRETLLNFLIREQITDIVHLAGVQFSNYVSRRTRKEFFNQNVEMARSLTYAANEAKVSRLIYVSTDMVYGRDIESPVSESHPTVPFGEYGLSKLEAERIFSSIGNFKLVILRPRLILGPGRVGTISKLAKLIDSPLPLILIGNGGNRYQFIGVQDVCKAIELFLNSEFEGIFNIGSDDPPKLDTLFKSTLSVLRRKKILLRIPSCIVFPILDTLDYMNIGILAPEQYKIANLDYVLSTDKLKSELKWNPSQSDEELLTLALKELL